MFIAGDMHQISQSPRGATTPFPKSTRTCTKHPKATQRKRIQLIVAPGYSGGTKMLSPIWNVSNLLTGSCIHVRRGWVPQPAGRGDLSPTIDTAPPIVPHLAPAGRHVYSTPHTPNIPKAPEGRHVYRRSDNQLPQYKRATTKVTLQRF